MTDTFSDAIFGDPREILLALSGRHHLPELLPLVTHLLAPNSDLALVRIWLKRPPLEDECNRCAMVSDCQNRKHCLHLVASYGHSQQDTGEHWDNLDGNFRRMPLGVRKVGHIAASGEIVRVKDVTQDSKWIVNPDWALRESIRQFVGLPLRYRDKTFGVLAIFSRKEISSTCDQWLRMIADHLAAAISNAQANQEIISLRRQLEMENEYLREEVRQTGFGELVGNSPALTTVNQQIDLVAPTDSTVLISGESGTGKELIARELHRRSHRSSKSLIKVNCAAIPRELYESEFFGHSKGSFTGAVRDRTGRFELADGGTLFLDEIGEIPMDLQAKLLRVLQEGELERIGEERTRRVNVRIIAATNRNLRKEAEAGRFRQDLYYRLSVFPIELPALRKRTEDIPLLADHFLIRLARQLGRKKLKLTLANVQQLQQYSWPGNIRELQHVLERSAILAKNGRLKFDLPAGEVEAKTGAVANDSESVLTQKQLRELERENIRRALTLTGSKIYGADGAAELLEMKPTTLASRIRSLGIK